ncbi:hypothetical protein HHK36_029966 [Tetracentron sinense]|uniref:HTH myb-type domain-containing protein n=1 Tax=Tetracentron sinense TaxID=13715 RepID=A0A834YBU0_TETSI|nr:hypothetical protein HHK36_029966 [Tetracentron sinense]
MNSIASPSHLPSSYSEDEHISIPPSPNYIAEIIEWEEEQALLIRLYASNNAFIAHFLEEDDEPKCRGSIPRHRVLNRGMEEGHVRLWNDYFSKNPTFGESLFCRQFRMRRSLFLRIVVVVNDHDNYFMQKKDGLKRCRKSCRLRWLNYLRPDLNRGEFTLDEVDLIIRLHKLLGNRQVKADTQKIEKNIVIKPRPWTFSKDSLWSRRETPYIDTNQSEDMLVMPSPKLPLGDDTLWWENKLAEMEEKEGTSCSITRSGEEEHLTNFWDEEMVPTTKGGDPFVEEDNNAWDDFCFDVDLWG